MGLGVRCGHQLLPASLFRSQRAWLHANGAVAPPGLGRASRVAEAQQSGKHWKVARLSRDGYTRPVNRYTFKCIRAGGPGPAVHIDACADDEEAHRRAIQLLELWPLAVKVDVSHGGRRFEVPRG